MTRRSFAHIKSGLYRIIYELSLTAKELGIVGISQQSPTSIIIMLASGATDSQKSIVETIAEIIAVEARITNGVAVSRLPAGDLSVSIVTPEMDLERLPPFQETLMEEAKRSFNRIIGSVTIQELDVTNFVEQWKLDRNDPSKFHTNISISVSVIANVN